MDVQWFLNERTDFLRYYYKTAAEPFLEIQRKIDKQVAPFEGEKYDEDGEPVYLEEWSASDDALGLLGRSCISMLYGSMRLYFEAWMRELRIELDDEDKKHFKKGALAGYRHVFESVLNNSWEACTADLAIIEQVALARNNDQHSGRISSIHAYHTDQDRKKFPNLFFLSEVDRRQLETDMGVPFFFASQLSVSEDQLFSAIGELEKLAAWLEPQLEALQLCGSSVAQKQS